MLDADEYRANRIASGSGYDLGASTDWMKEVSRVGVRTQHTLTLSGGNAKSNYRASVQKVLTNTPVVRNMVGVLR